MLSIKIGKAERERNTMRTVKKPNPQKWGMRENQSQGRIVSPLGKGFCHASLRVVLCVSFIAAWSKKHQ